MSGLKGGCICHPSRGEESRRGFLKVAAAGGAAALLGVSPLGQARASGQVEALLLSCMDFRLVDDTARYMDGRGLTNSYDHVILAGASLGAQTDQKSNWGAAFWDHVEVAKSLHRIKKVMVLDHRDCGAYRVFLGEDLKHDPVKEAAVHRAWLTKLSGEIQRRHPELAVETLLMNLDGSVEAMG